MSPLTALALLPGDSLWAEDREGNTGGAPQVQGSRGGWNSQCS